jgi:hypothetical protein
MTDQENCYQCRWRRPCPGDCHSSCGHPDIVANPNVASILSFFMIAKSDSAPVKTKLTNIKADPHGVRNGWFMWPFNFDPVWLQECYGFEASDAPQI